MAKKEFTYRGKNLDDLMQMSLTEFSKLLPSSERRKIKRGLTEPEKQLVKELRKRNNVKTHCRTMIILPEMTGKTVLVHRGNKFDQVIVQAEMIGHRLGEYAQTRSSVSHSSPGVGATRSSASVSVR